MNFTRLTSREEVERLILSHNEQSEFVTLDCETTSVNPRTARLIDVQLSDLTDDSAVIFSGEFAELLTKLSPSVTIVGHSIKYDLHVLYLHGTDLLSRNFRDTILIGHLLDENRDSYSLDSFVKEHWNDGYKEEFWSKYKSYEEAPEEDKVQYSCKDVFYTSSLYRRQIEALSREGVPLGLVQHVHRLQASLFRTEIGGIRVDLYYLEELGVRLKRRIDELKPQMRSCVADETEILELETWQKEIDKRKTDKGKSGVKRPEFSFESTKQLQLLLYDLLRLPRQYNAKTKALSTDYASLEQIKASHPVVELIQENRELQKVYTAYVEGTLERLEYDRESTPRIYPQFRVNGTATGRISHNSPNLAQLPKTGGVRAIYVPDSGRRFISADYNQLEVIAETNLTGDKTLIRMLENGESKHDVTSRELGCSRDLSKTLNFALQYWCTAGKVAKLLGVSSAEGNRIYKKYWEVYSGAKKLKAQTDKMVDEGIPLTTVFGRKRRFGIRSRSPFDGDYRQAYNFLIQGTGADITSKAFYEASEELFLDGTGRGLFTVHDEILIEVNDNWADYWNNRLKEIMEAQTEAAKFTIPLKATPSGPMLAWLD